MTVPLRECPCCRSRNVIMDSHTPDTNSMTPADTYYFVQCQNCGIRTDEWTLESIEAVKTWNNRPESQMLIQWNKNKTYLKNAIAAAKRQDTSIGISTTHPHCIADLPSSSTEGSSVPPA